MNEIISFTLIVIGIFLIASTIKYLRLSKEEKDKIQPKWAKK